MLSQRFRHIAIEGPIGVGKSSLARRLAELLGAKLFLEQPQDNPYLERFYRAGTDNLQANPYALPTQLFFLFQRLEQMRELAQPGMFDERLVSDFLFAKDALFARLTLADEDHLLYTQIYRRYAPRIPQPDLVIWLRAEVPALQRRIARRGLAMERGIAPDYLARLSEGYVRLFSELPGVPVLAIDTDDFNPIDNDEHFEALVDRLTQFRGPRERWGPAALV
ncbi:MAG TPA: deoxynucleoside kinase [Burkholderiaceae bacterium]|nr:deoxynucleoside kinase [Burkholderiaceae bacterium]